QRLLRPVLRDRGAGARPGADRGLAQHLPPRAAGEGPPHRRRVSRGPGCPRSHPPPRRRSLPPGPGRAGGGRRLSRGHPAPGARRRRGDPRLVADWASTHRLPVRVMLAEGLVIQGEAHLQPRVAWRDGPETPVEMLNRADAFFAVSLPHGDIVFVAKDQVAAVGYVEVKAEDDSDRKTAARLIPLEVMMIGGVEHRGVAVSELPPTRA